MEEVSQDRFVNSISAHVVQQHPEVPPDEAVTIVEKAVANTEIVEANEQTVEPYTWSYDAT